MPGRKFHFRGRHAMAQHHDDIPEGFTLSLALVDALPVALFTLSAITLGSKLDSPAFVSGAVVTFAAGACKVLWKLILATNHRDVQALSRQMRYMMPVGFLLMIVGLMLRASALPELVGGLLRLPSLPFLLLWLVCMVLMGYFAGHREQRNARNNWVEQGVNTLGQASLLVALLLLG